MRRGQRAGYSQSIFHHGLGRGCGVGRGLGNGVGLGVAVGVGLGVTVEVGVGVTVGLGSWRCTGCWCWTGQARTNHVNKTSDHLLVPLVGGLHAGDEEATFILVGDYRAAS